MKFLSYRARDADGVAVERGDQFFGLDSRSSDYPGDLARLIGSGNNALEQAGEQLRTKGQPLHLDQVSIRPPVMPGKILCVGLNYADHAAEANMQVPEFPTIFSRFASSVVASGEAIRLPRVSSALDFEGELAVVIGHRGRSISHRDALDHVAGYSVFNDASIRDYQLRTTQWTLGKNFDGTGPFGPYLMTPEDLPPGASGLKIETRLNGQIVQSSSTDQLIFNVATLISYLSKAMTLEPGDVIITGTPAGVGNARTPKLFMKDGDVCEVEIERIGTLQNPVKADG